MNLTDLLHKKRWIKTQNERQILQKAADISAGAYLQVMKNIISPGVSEAVVDAALEFECIKGGGQRLAYPPVVAGGINANTLHYIFNDSLLKDGEMILIDAGTEYYCYSSDITRTFPINGKFSPAQEALYEMVLEVQKKCIELCTVDSTLNSIHTNSVYLLCRGLIQLGICKESFNSLVSSGRYRRFYPHGVGHYLGMLAFFTITSFQYISTLVFFFEGMSTILQAYLMERC